MPDFSRAQVSASGADLSAYSTFLRKLTVGQTVTLPLEQGETPRKVMRDLNAAASQSQMRLARVGSDSGAVRFRVVSPDKREVAISDDAKQARVAKARATREAHRMQRDQVPAAAVDPGQDGTVAGDAPAGEVGGSAGPVPSDQQVQASAAVEQAPPQRTRRPRRASAG